MVTTTTTTPSAPTVGAKAPDFTLPVSTGGTFVLSEAAKKGPVVVCFMPGAFTGTCTKEMCSFTDSLNHYVAVGAQVVGVTVDSKHALNAWAARDNIKVPLLSDFEKKTNAQWGVRWESPWGVTNKRATFVVDRTMTVRYANVQTNASEEPPYAEIQNAVQAAT